MMSWYRIGFVIFLIFLEPKLGGAFIVALPNTLHPTVPSSSSFFQISTLLFLKPQIKNNNNNKASIKSESDSKSSQRPLIAATTTAKRNSPKTNTKSAPPWQVLSTGEASKNVVKEIQRRENSRLGVNVSPSPPTNVVLSKAFLSEQDQRFLRWKRFNPVTAPNGMRFVGSYLDRRLPPSLGVPEIAFLGRSNVGKSSLLNRLFSTASRKESSSDEARVGKTPGATASVNLYALTAPSAKNPKQAATKQSTPSATDILGFVDLPGFGYAKLSKDIQDSVQKTAENYLDKRRELALGILLVDIRRAPPSDDDKAVLAALYDMGIPLLVVATKIDKIKSATRLEQNLESIRNGLGLPEGQPLAVSSVTGQGINLLWNIVLEACESSVGEFKKLYCEKAAAENKNEDFDDSPKESTLDEDDDDEEEEDIVYAQGYDWIHDDFSDYDDEEGTRIEEDDDDNEEDNEDAQDKKSSDPNEMDFQSLKKLARDMERRGQL